VSASRAARIDWLSTRAFICRSEALITIGACATAGGVQALRNFVDVDGYVAAVHASPAYIRTLATSTPISAHFK
jgi:sulfhydrogenase subunit delta